MFYNWEMVEDGLQVMWEIRVGGAGSISNILTRSHLYIN